MGRCLLPVNEAPIRRQRPCVAALFDRMTAPELVYCSTPQCCARIDVRMTKAHLSKDSVAKPPV
jgi:hypothetical protein